MFCLKHFRHVIPIHVLPLGDEHKCWMSFWMDEYFIWFIMWLNEMGWRIDGRNVCLEFKWLYYIYSLCKFKIFKCPLYKEDSVKFLQKKFFPPLFHMTKLKKWNELSLKFIKLGGRWGWDVITELQYFTKCMHKLMGALCLSLPIPYMN